MSDRMNEQEARAMVLQMLRERLVEHQQAVGGDRELGPELELTEDDFGRFGEVLGWGTSEVSALYKRLVRGGFVRQKDGDTRVLEIGGVIQYAWVDDLTDKGYRTIGVLDDPNEELLSSLDAIAEAIEVLRGADPKQKSLAQKALGELKYFARGLPPEAAAEVFKAGSTAFAGG